MGGGAEGLGGCLRRIGEVGGGANFLLFSGPKRPPSNSRGIIGDF